MPIFNQTLQVLKPNSLGTFESLKITNIVFRKAKPANVPPLCYPLSREDRCSSYERSRAATQVAACAVPLLDSAGIPLMRRPQSYGWLSSAGFNGGPLTCRSQSLPFPQHGGSPADMPSQSLPVPLLDSTGSPLTCHLPGHDRPYTPSGVSDEGKGAVDWGKGETMH